MQTRSATNAPDYYLLLLLLKMDFTEYILSESIISISIRHNIELTCNK